MDVKSHLGYWEPVISNISLNFYLLDLDIPKDPLVLLLEYCHSRACRVPSEQRPGVDIRMRSNGPCILSVKSENGELLDSINN